MRKRVILFYGTLNSRLMPFYWNFACCLVVNEVFYLWPRDIWQSSLSLLWQCDNAKRFRNGSTTPHSMKEEENNSALHCYGVSCFTVTFSFHWSGHACFPLCKTKTSFRQVMCAIKGQDEPGKKIRSEGLLSSHAIVIFRTFPRGRYFLGEGISVFPMFGRRVALYGGWYSDIFFSFRWTIF